MEVFNIKFEHILIILTIIILTLSLYFFREDKDISKMLIVTLSNSMVFSITKYFELNQNEKNKNKDD